MQHRFWWRYWLQSLWHCWVERFGPIFLGVGVSLKKNVVVPFVWYRSSSCRVMEVTLASISLGILDGLNQSSPLGWDLKFEPILAAGLVLYLDIVMQSARDTKLCLIVGTVNFLWVVTFKRMHNPEPLSESVYLKVPFCAQFSPESQYLSIALVRRVRPWNTPQDCTHLSCPMTLILTWEWYKGEKSSMLQAITAFLT